MKAANKVENKLQDWAQAVQSKNRGKAQKLLVKEREGMRDVPKINDSSKRIAQQKMKGQFNKPTQSARRCRSGTTNGALKQTEGGAVAIQVNLGLSDCRFRLRFTPEKTVDDQQSLSTDRNKGQRDLYETIIWGQQRCEGGTARPVEYSSISPSKAVISYSAGMDYDTFKKRARPVVAYKGLN